ILTSGGNNYHIAASSSNAMGSFKNTVTILDDGTPLPVQGAAMTLQQDDYSSRADILGNTQSGSITASGLPVGGQVTVTTNMTIAAANRFFGGTLRVANTNFPSVANTARAKSRA